MQPNAQRSHLLAAAAKAPELLRRLGAEDIATRPPLGEGSFALAWRLDDGRVLKLTTDDTDAKAAARVMKDSPVPGLTAVYEVYELPKPMWGRAYAIVAEYAKPVSKMLESSRVEVSLGLAVTAMNRSYPPDALSPQEMMDLVVDDYEPIYAPDRTVVRASLRHLDELIHGWSWLHERGFKLDDINDSNVGFTDEGRAVHLDFGGSEHKSDDEENEVPIASNSGSFDFGLFDEPADEASPSPTGYEALRDLRRDDLFRVGGRGPVFRVVQSYDDTTKSAVKHGSAGRTLYVTGVAGRDDYSVSMFPTSGGSLDPVGESIVKPGLVVKVSAVEKNAKDASRLPRTSAIFDALFDQLAADFDDFGEIELHCDEEAGSDNGHGSERQFGYCSTSQPWRIAFASKIETLPDEYIDGLVRHELGHALDHRYGRKALAKRFGKKLPESVERRADKIAEYAFGTAIEYGDLDIQCVACEGKASRPKRLG